MTGRPDQTGEGTGRRFPTWLPWVVIAATLSLSFGWKALCLNEPAWSGAIQYRLYCYSDITALWFTRGFSEGLIPYLDQSLEYPPLIGLQIAATSSLTRVFGGDLGWFFTLNGLINGAAAVWILITLRHFGDGRRRILWWAAAPPLALYAFHNWDLPALALLVAAVLAHRNDRDGLSGLALGLGASAKLLPALALPLLVIARLKQRRPWAALRVVMAAGAAWAVVNLPVALAAPDAWSEFFRFSAEREVTAATVWAVLHRWGVLVAAPENVNILATTAFGLGALSILGFGWTRLRGEKIWTLILPLLAWFFLTNKVFSPQFDLWPVPFLALLSGPAMLSAFFAVDLFAFFAEMSFLGRRGSFGWVTAATLARSAVLVWMSVFWVRSTPRLDPHPGVGRLLRERDAVPDGSEVHEGGHD